MYKLIGGDQKEYGPVSAEEMGRWIQEGRLNGQSWIRLEGATEWKPLGSFPEFAAMLGAQGQPQPPPAPGVVAPLNPQAFSAQALAGTSQIAIGSCLSRSLGLLKDNFFLLYGSTFIVWVIGFIAFFIPFGGALYFIFKGVFYGGLYLVFIKRIRDQPASIGDTFSGFQSDFVQLMLAGVVTGLVVWIARTPCCLILPGLYLFIAWLFAVPLVADRGLEFWTAMELSRKAVTKVWFEMLGLVVLAFLPFIIFYVFVHMRIGANFLPIFQEAVSGAQPDFNRIFQLGMRIARENLLSLVILKVVWMLNWPFALGALMYAYEDLFGARKTGAP